MDILYVSNGYPPRRWAGTENYTAGLAREFSARGARVRVLCAGDWDTGPAHDNGCQDTIHEGVAVRRVNLNWTKARDPFRCLYDNPVAGEALESLLDECRPDVVHVTSCETLSARVLTVASRRGLPLVLSLTDFWFLCPRTNLLRADGENCSGRTTAWDCTRCLAGHTKAYRWLRALLPEASGRAVLSVVGRTPRLSRLRGLRGMVGDVDARKRHLTHALTLPDARITASPFVQRVHAENGVVAPIAVQPYGHDLSWLSSSPGRETSPVLRLGYVGQLLPSKGVHVLLEAVRRLQSVHGNRFTVQVYGDMSKSPAYGQQLSAMAKALPNVRFMGTYGFADSARVYTGFDVLVVPSLWYDFPLVMHEALAAGAPVIATDLGGMAEAISDGRNGLLFDRGSASSLADRIRRLLDEPDLLETLRRGIGPVKTTRMECDDLQGLYESLVVKARAGSRQT